MTSIISAIQNYAKVGTEYLNLFQMYAEPWETLYSYLKSFSANQ